MLNYLFIFEVTNLKNDVATEKTSTIVRPFPEKRTY